jgi:predicted amidohydrolase
LEAHGKGRDAVRQVNSLGLDSPWMTQIAGLAKKYRMVVIPDVMLRRGDKFSNTCVVFGPEGNVLGEYSKTHVAPEEEKCFDPGNSIATVATPFGKIGLMICYDINFPELTRCYEMLGAELLLWTTMRQGEHEEGLYRAVLPGRAITHGIPLGVSTYVSEMQQIDRNPMSSVLYNVFGQVVAGNRITPGVVRGTIDLDERPLERRTWSNPEWVCSTSYLRRQRRPDLYGVLVKPMTAEERNRDNEPTVRGKFPNQKGD